QPGHAKHERVPFAAEQIAQRFDYCLETCPDCGHPLRDIGLALRVVQQVDVGDIPLRVEEHRQHARYCPGCSRVVRAALPASVEKGGLLGPHLTALVAFLKGVCHASFSTVRKFLRDIIKVEVSRGYLAKVVAKVSEALQQPYAELLAQLPDEACLHVDETGHK